MAFIPVPNTAKVAVEQEYDGQEVINTLYFSNPSGWNSTTLIALAGGVESWFESNVLPHLSSGLTLVQVTATDLGTEGGAQGISVADAGTVGGVGTAGLPGSVAFCVSLRTGRTGRSFRGRNYLCGMSQGDLQSAGTWRATTIANLVGAYHVLITSPITAATWVVVSRFHDKAPRSVGITTPILNVLAADTAVDNQRRRLPRRGR